MIACSSRVAEAHRILLIHTTDPAAPPGGRAMLSRLNARLLDDLFGDRLRTFRLPVRAGRWRGAIRGVVRGHVDGIDDASLGEIGERIETERIDTVFLDGSNLGAVAAAIKATRPDVRVITFLHNVEARFFWGAVLARRSVRSLAILVANAIAERKAVRASDVLVVLSERDSAGLGRLYGRRADAVAPMVLDDGPAISARSLPPASATRQRYVLFVGGSFYANIAGIDWFVRTVAPRIGVHVIVVGRGMDMLADRFAGNGAVTLVGDVDDLAPWYAGAMLVIAPIFDGSGMKTKVAEALMFGKHVAGTPEAFSGYAQDVIAANACCRDADAFVAALALAGASPPPAFDPAMRALYDRDHSPAAARARLARLFAADPQGPSQSGPVSA